MFKVINLYLGKTFPNYLQLNAGTSSNPMELLIFFRMLLEEVL